jgi:hypothetical protein
MRQLDDMFKKRMEVVLSLMIQIGMNYHSAFEVPGTKKPPRMSPAGKFLSLRSHKQGDPDLLEMEFMGFLIYLRMGVSTQVTIARQMGELRKDIRSKFRDIYTNTPTVTQMYKWVDKAPIERPRPGQEVAAVEWQNDGVPHSIGGAKKRKNVDDDDTDYRGSSSTKSRAAPPPKTRKTVESRSSSSSINLSAAPPPPPAVRPPAPSMDNASRLQFGIQHGGMNPHATHDQRQYQVCSDPPFSSYVS